MEKKYKQQFAIKEEEDTFLRYLSRKVKGLLKKMEHEEGSKKHLQEQIAMFTNMREHYLTALTRKDDKEERLPEDYCFRSTKPAFTISQLMVYRGLLVAQQQQRTELHHQLRNLNPHGLEVLERCCKIAGPVEDTAQKSLKQIVDTRAREIEQALTNPNLTMFLQQIAEHPKISEQLYSVLKQEVVVQEPDSHGSSEEEVLKENNSSSDDKKKNTMGQNNYDGDEEVVFTGDSDTNLGEGKLKKRGYATRKKNTKKKYQDEENYYASQEEAQAKSSFRVGHGWRAKVGEGFDTDREKEKPSHQKKLQNEKP